MTQHMAKDTTKQAPVAPDEFPNEKLMTLLEHLNEFKDRIIRIAIAVAVWGAASFVLAQRILELLLAPMHRYEGLFKVIATKPTTTIGLFMKISLFTGAVFAMPWIVREVLLFILPGLTRKERRALMWIIPGAFLFFLVGAAFAYFVMIPTAIPFLLGFWAELIEQNWMVDEYVPFVTGLIFWVGISFETPLIMAFVARTGAANYRQYLAVWKYAMVVIAVLAAFITPTPDPFNMGLVMFPLISLYFFGVFLSWLAEPREKRGGFLRRAKKS